MIASIYTGRPLILYCHDLTIFLLFTHFLSKLAVAHSTSLEGRLVFLWPIWRKVFWCHVILFFRAYTKKIIASIKLTGTRKPVFLRDFQFSTYHIHGEIESEGSSPPPKILSKWILYLKIAQDILNKEDFEGDLFHGEVVAIRFIRSMSCSNQSTYNYLMQRRIFSSQ